MLFESHRTTREKVVATGLSLYFATLAVSMVVAMVYNQLERNEVKMVQNLGECQTPAVAGKTVFFSQPTLAEENCINSVTANTDFTTYRAIEDSAGLVFGVTTAGAFAASALFVGKGVSHNLS